VFTNICQHVPCRQDTEFEYYLLDLAANDDITVNLWKLIRPMSWKHLAVATFRGGGAPATTNVAGSAAVANVHTVGDPNAQGTARIVDEGECRLTAWTQRNNLYGINSNMVRMRRAPRVSSRATTRK